MSMQIPVAAATVRGGPVGPLTVTTGPHTMVVDDAGPTPLELMTSSLAACSALSVRSYLARSDGSGGIESTGEIAVTVTLDAGPPTVLHRRVVLPGRPGAEHVRGMADALERTEITRLLRPSYPIRTAIETEDSPWPSPDK